MIPHLQQIAKNADHRFPKLAGHGERTASYAVAAADKLGIPLHRLQALRIAAALHYAWSEVGECPCCEPAGAVLTKWQLPGASLAADFIRGMRADWNMSPPESSILNAACRFDLKRIGVEIEDQELRPGVQEALESIAGLITPLDAADV